VEERVVNLYPLPPEEGRNFVGWRVEIRGAPRDSQNNQAQGESAETEVRHALIRKFFKDPAGREAALSSLKKFFLPAFQAMGYKVEFKDTPTDQ
jgi:hypothetical protein